MIIARWERKPPNIMIKHLKKILFLSLVPICTMAQNYDRLPSSGTIEFQKTINMHALIRKAINKTNENVLVPAFDNFKKSEPQFRTLRSTLQFADEKTLYTPIEGSANSSGGFFSNYPEISENNIVFTDFKTGSSTSQRKVFDELFLLKDAIRPIKWKMTSEIREIAGYNCRRANAVILDSIYVVAFYTDKIPVSGGPESFSGLPGMILGVALPHENMTWFATKVSLNTSNADIPASPQKGKGVNNIQFSEKLKVAVKSWGDYARTAYKFFML